MAATKARSKKSRTISMGRKRMTQKKVGKCKKCRTTIPIDKETCIKCYAKSFGVTRTIRG